jgi:hypothetical protein
MAIEKVDFPIKNDDFPLLKMVELISNIPSGYD